MVMHYFSRILGALCRQVLPRGGGVARQAGAVLCLALVGGAGGGCGDGAATASGPGVYGPWPSRDVAPAASPSARPARPKPKWSGDAVLSVLQTEFSPASLWHSRERTVNCFAGMQSAKLGPPTFLAYSSPTGIATLRPGETVNGTELRENWMLVGFAGAAGWNEWDSPWAVFLQRRPATLSLGSNGVEIAHAEAVGHFSMMPLYGYYKPPQRGRELLEKQGLKEKGLLTWEWNLVVARDPLTRLRYWSGVTRRVPFACEESVDLDVASEAVTIHHAFEWLEIPDEWGTRPISLAPVSPVLGLTQKHARPFPATFSKKPFDFEIPTPFGPYFGVPDAEGYSVTFPALGLVTATESAQGMSPGSRGAEIAAQAAGRVAERARAVWGSGAALTPASAGDATWLRDIPWHARAAAMGDASTRANATRAIRAWLSDRVLVEREFDRNGWSDKASAGRSVVADAWAGDVLRAVWAHAHFLGDRSLLRERWPLLRRLIVAPTGARWATFGGSGDAALGRGVSVAVASARLAYLAGDADRFSFASAQVARELAVDWGRVRAAAWIRDQQPWHSLDPVPEDARAMLSGPGVGSGAWGWSANSDAVGTPGFTARWREYPDPEVARFYRAQLSAEIQADVRAIQQSTRREEWGREGTNGVASVVRLRASLLPSGATNRWAGVTPGEVSGSDAGVMAACLAMATASTEGEPKLERLIPSGHAWPRWAVPVREGSTAFPVLLQRVVEAPGGGGGRLRVEWSGWKTPTGAPWMFGDVSAGGGGGRVRRSAVEGSSEILEIVTSPAGGR